MRPVISKSSLCKSLMAVLLVCGTFFQAGCSTVRSENSDPIDHMFVLLLPFKNLTSTPNAGKAISALFVSSITVHRAMYLSSSDNGTTKELAKMAESGTLPENILVPLARQHIDAVLFGNVTEYEYRSGLSTEPIVGFTWKMISTRTGRTIWVGAVSKVDSCFWVCHDTLAEFARNLVDVEIEKRLSED